MTIDGVVNLPESDRATVLIYGDDEDLNRVLELVGHPTVPVFVTRDPSAPVPERCKIRLIFPGRRSTAVPIDWDAYDDDHFSMFNLEDSEQDPEIMEDLIVYLAFLLGRL